MKLFVMLSVIAIALVPLAAGSAGVSGGVNTSGSGDCAAGTNAYHQNQAGANAGASGVGSASAGAGTYCQAYQDFFTGQVIRYNDVHAGASACTAAAGCAGASIVWYKSGSFCNTAVAVSGQPTQNLGCPAGAPPVVPALA